MDFNNNIHNVLLYGPTCWRLMIEQVIRMQTTEMRFPQRDRRIQNEES
jgi:hypothetical protein